MAGILAVIGYPHSLSLSTDSLDDTKKSVEMLYTVPRVLMGLLAVADTFLIYKISEKRYNRKVAFIACILFAVMPLGWLTRRIVLESILLPFLLSSILFDLQIHTPTSKIPVIEDIWLGTRISIKWLCSPLFLWISCIYEITAVIMIPLVAYLIIKNIARYDKKLKILGLWFIPVLTIPLIWPESIY